MFERRDTIANLACSVLKRFGAEEIPNLTLPMADRLLAGGHQNVAVLLLDSMGMENLEELLDADGFFRTHLEGAYSSVFPPTTVAATTSMDSGLFPSQHGWLGWTMYYPELHKNVVVFTNRDDFGQPAAAFAAARRYTPYVSVIDRICEAGGDARRLSPYEGDKVTSLEDMGEKLAAITREAGQKYIYCYWPEPDSTMHKNGSRSEKARAVLRAAEKTVEAFSERLHDTLLLITADHGHTDGTGHVLDSCPRVAACLERLPSIEPRALNFFVKKGMENAFQTAFREAFGGAFRLFTRAEALETGLFGPAPYHPHLAHMLGEYIAVALQSDTLFNTVQQMEALKGVHAGGTDRERLIPLIAVEC